MRYDELCQAILDAREELLKHKIEANTIILNGRKYGCLFEPGMRPSIFGMAVECDAAIPDRYDFIVQYREPEPQTNADRIRGMSDEEMADFLCHWDNCASTEGLGYNTEKVGNCWLCSAPGGGDIDGECQACAMAWLKSPVDKEGEG